MLRRKDVEELHRLVLDRDADDPRQLEALRRFGSLREAALHLLGSREFIHGNHLRLVEFLALGGDEVLHG